MASQISTFLRDFRLRTGLTQLQFGRLLENEQGNFPALELGLKPPSHQFLTKLVISLNPSERDRDEMEQAVKQSKRRSTLPVTSDASIQPVDVDYIAVVCQSCAPKGGAAETQTLAAEKVDARPDDEGVRGSRDELIFFGRGCDLMPNGLSSDSRTPSPSNLTGREIITQSSRRDLLDSGPDRKFAKPISCRCVSSHSPSFQFRELLELPQ